MPRLPSIFAKDDKGSLPIMVAVLMLPIIVATGGAIDLVAHERMRAKLQDSLDRGVLAAASLSQTQPAKETVTSFVRSANAATKFDLSIDETRATNSRVVSATLQAEKTTTFLRLVGIDTMSVAVRSTAEEKRTNVEISLLLDVSGSMRWNSSGTFPGHSAKKRIDYLKPAAKGFLDTVLSDDAREYTSVSLVPYAGQVNVGPAIFDRLLRGTRRHSKSSCFEFTAAELTIGMPSFTTRGQTPHFTHWNHHSRMTADEQRSTEPWWCPDDPHGPVPAGEIDFVRNETTDTDVTAVSLMSNDREFLKSRIDNYKLYDGTGTPIALKWGLLFLDPAFRPTIASASSSLAAEIGLNASFKDRPAAFSDTGTSKFLVLMTDGAINEQVRPKDTSRSVHYSSNSADNETIINTATMESRAQTLCSQAKERGVTVFTIGFDVNDSVATQMTKCASSASHFYRVTSLNVADAFNSIATAIQQIKLTR